MSTTQDAAITELGRLILEMGALAEAILARALEGVRERDPEAADQVKQDDLEIDRLELRIDDAVLRALALQAPVAATLRRVISIKTMATDLERVGDLARNIARSGARLAERPEVELSARLQPLENAASALLRRALDAFQRNDPEAARAVIDDDDEVDQLQDDLVRDLVRTLEERPEIAWQVVDLILIAEGLERVGDHATNIAEDVILIAEARNVKHAAKLEVAEG